MSVPAEDLVLPADVRPLDGAADVDAPALVTGASGFLGAAVAADLLEHTDEDVYCLVRPAGGTAQERVEGALRYYDLWREEWAGRVIGVAGDLARPRCGLDDADHRTLATRTGAIYHCGAGVNVSFPYDALRGANVSGTVEILRLASTARPKRLAHVSTVSVLYGRGGTDRVEDFTELGPAGALGGYALSKWAAEALVAQARDRGFDALVLRSGTLAGHARTGVSNPNDYAWLFLRTCAAMGAAPLADSPLQWAPVDYAARAVTELTRRKNGGPEPAAYHLIAPERTRYTTLFSWMRRFGYTLRTADFALWRKRVLDAAVESSHDGVRQIAATLPEADRDGGTVPPDVASDRTDAVLAAAGIVCPPLDEALARTYFAAGVRRAELRPPDRPEA
ncbi:thioester reductase domain-containing protein [Wenjunlia tyrosinilytica]|nr:thioester reductase domain-containing protein [Wenjunlia tyrosinilytica]